MNYTNINNLCLKKVLEINDELKKEDIEQYLDLSEVLVVATKLANNVKACVEDSICASVVINEEDRTKLKKSASIGQLTNVSQSITIISFGNIDDEDEWNGQIKIEKVK